jgi:hypothetical protein
MTHSNFQFFFTVPKRCGQLLLTMLKLHAAILFLLAATWAAATATKQQSEQSVNHLLTNASHSEKKAPRYRTKSNKIPPLAKAKPNRAPAQQAQPNIILMVADDLGYNDVSWHNPDIKSPHLEQLAVEGIRLEQAYVQPICTPTRTTILHKYNFTKHC